MGWQEDIPMTEGHPSPSALQLQDEWTGSRMGLLPEPIFASATGQKKVHSFPPQQGKRGFLWESGKGWEHNCMKLPQLCHSPCPKNFYKLWLSRNHRLSLPPVFSLLSENAQSCFIISLLYYLPRMSDSWSWFHNWPQFLHTDWSISFVISNLVIKRNSPKYKHTTLLLFLSCQERACPPWRPQIRDHRAFSSGVIIKWQGWDMGVLGLVLSW